MTDPIKAAQGTISVVGEVIKLAGESPEVRAAGGELGKTALTITKAINNALLPLAAVNVAFDKARNYFSERFEKELTTKVAEIPADDLIEPKASVAGPALQGLAFSHEEPDLKNLYLNLLATAMDARVAAGVHPTFVEIIRQLTAEEASLLRTVLRERGTIAAAEVRVAVAGGGFRVLYRPPLAVSSA
ncbi:MAG TPA: DUF4393 domain-containing protein [Vicinamibacterales bacterium]|nr:DUF4393 domain-containing protein [Vicinamibacterales bacterium]